METDGANLVAALFTSHRRADAALRDLHQIGLTDADVEIGVPEPGQYRIEYHEAQELGRGGAFGVAIGVPTGSVIATGIFMIAVPEMSLAAAIGLGGLVGGYWGIFFGGLGGMAWKLIAQADGEPRCAVTDGSPDVLVIAHAGDQTSAARAILRSYGARYILTDVPAVRHSHAPLAMPG